MRSLDSIFQAGLRRASGGSCVLLALVLGSACAYTPQYRPRFGDQRARPVYEGNRVRAYVPQVYPRCGPGEAYERSGAKGNEKTVAKTRTTLAGVRPGYLLLGAATYDGHLLAAGVLAGLAIGAGTIVATPVTAIVLATVPAEGKAGWELARVNSFNDEAQEKRKACRERQQEVQQPAGEEAP